MVIAEIAKNDPQVLAETTPEGAAEVVSVAEDQLLGLMDESALLAAESEEEQALLGTVEETGQGKLAAEEAWYQDPNKLFMAAVAGVLTLAVIK